MIFELRTQRFKPHHEFIFTHFAGESAIYGIAPFELELRRAVIQKKVKSVKSVKSCDAFDAFDALPWRDGMIQGNWTFKDKNGEVLTSQMPWNELKLAMKLTLEANFDWTEKPVTFWGRLQ